jgi:hypothetical protein
MRSVPNHRLRVTRRHQTAARPCSTLPRSHCALPDQLPHTAATTLADGQQPWFKRRSASPPRRRACVLDQKCRARATARRRSSTRSYAAGPSEGMLPRYRSDRSVPPRDTGPRLRTRNALTAALGTVAGGVEMHVLSRSLSSPSRSNPHRVRTTMRAVVITEHGGPEVLQVQQRPDPPVGPGEVRIAVKAAGINFADTLARTGLYPDAPKVPCVVGYEVAGEVGSSSASGPRRELAPDGETGRGAQALEPSSVVRRAEESVVPRRIGSTRCAGTDVLAEGRHAGSGACGGRRSCRCGRAPPAGARGAGRRSRSGSPGQIRRPLHAALAGLVGGMPLPSISGWMMPSLKPNEVLSFGSM